MATLFINRNDSECGDCERGADPYEKAHVTALGYFPIDTPDDSPRRKGCGAEFTKVGSRYMGDGIRRAAQEMRPDLPWTEDLM